VSCPAQRAAAAERARLFAEMTAAGDAVTVEQVNAYLAACETMSTSREVDEDAAVLARTGRRITR